MTSEGDLWRTEGISPRDTVYSAVLFLASARKSTAAEYTVSLGKIPSVRHRSPSEVMGFCYYYIQSNLAKTTTDNTKNHLKRTNIYGPKCAQLFSMGIEPG